MILIVWAVFGALVGVAAAQKHGFSLAGGLLGGILLGPLAFLMFLARQNNRKPCPYCQTWVDAKATVCHRCLRDISPRAVWEARRPKRP